MVLLGIHALIHFFGFFKAFEIAQFDALTKPVSRAMGLAWLLAGTLLILSLLLFAMKTQYWWAIALVGVLFSQVLIFTFWKDARFGTILNIVILIPAIIAYFNYSFQLQISKERTEMLESANSANSATLTESDLAELPTPVRKWLLNSGAVGKPVTQTLYLEQDLEMQMKHGDDKWNKARADQYFTIDPPAFNWSVTMEMNPLVPINGRDKFDAGKGEMLIKLFSAIPMVNSKDSPRIDEATLQRYLAEIVWFPSAAVSPYITWESLDEHSALATMEYRGTRGSGTFHFDQNGNFQKFVTMRYKNVETDEKLEWVVEAQKTEERSGIKVPVQCEAKWNMDGEYWTWLKLKITSIDYDGS
jgi:hypothetical protein